MNSEFYLRLGLFGLCVAVVVGLVSWLVWRKNRKAERERLDELTAFAASLGGTVTDRRAGARPWSADLAGAMGASTGRSSNGWEGSRSPASTTRWTSGGGGGRCG
ncbi:hypothetical protein ABZ345_30235 [Lentzea sp. NPDC005914]|uniref:hypothetical protein n=1 Tax=Lentzea sp. NPDC005914 TaxID=3154572 RepID=UPI0033F5AF4C